MLDEQVDGMEDVLVCDTHRHDVVAVVRHTGSQGTPLQPKAPDESHSRLGGLVAIDDHDFQDVALHVAHDTPILHFGLSDETLGNQLSVLALDDLDLLAHIGQEDIVGMDELGSEDVRTQRLLVMDVRHAVFRHQHPPDIGLLGDRMAQVVDHDEVGIVAQLQQAHVEFVVLDGIERGRLQHIHHLVAQVDGLTHQHVDMDVVQLVGVLVVGAEHQPVGMGGHQRYQGLEVTGGTALTDEDLHAEADFLQGTRQAETLVVGGDARPHVFLQVVARHRRRMAVDRLPVPLGGGDFPHQLRVLVDDARVVHHLREVIDVVVGHQLLNVVGIQAGPCRLEGGGGHTTRCAKEELERHLLAVFYHVFDAVLAQHIGDFMRVADGGHRTVTGRQAGKLGRHQHGAFDVDMRIDEARHDVLCVADRLFLNLGDFTVLNDNDPRENPGMNKVNNLTAYGEAMVHGFCF